MCTSEHSILRTCCCPFATDALNLIGGRRKAKSSAPVEILSLLPEDPDRPLELLMEHAPGPWDWDAWLTNTHKHVMTLTERIRHNAIQASGNDVKAYRSTGLIDPATGHRVGGTLCWVCFSTRPHSGHLLPTFRACWWYLHYDKQQAAKIGFKMLLPLMDWHCQPVLPEHHFPKNPETRRILKTAWSTAPLLEEWRQENVIREYALMAEPGQPPIHLCDWMQRFGYSLHRSMQTWWHFVEVYVSELGDLLDDHGRQVV